MPKLLLLPILATAALAGCQPTPSSSTGHSSASPATAAAAITTAAAARVAVARYIQAQPNAALYVPDSASVVDADAHWQVLVPRTDWARRMPNRARFEVDKQTGQVSSQPVK